MSHTFDAGSKTLLELGPAEWLELFGVPRPAGRLRIIPAELSTVTAMADHVVQVDDPDPWLLHVEFQAQWDGALPRRMLAYNGALIAKYDLPVASVAVLLSPAANASNLTGILPVAPPFGEPWDFRYTVVRLWQLPVQSFLDGPASLLPLTLLADVRKPDLIQTAGAVQDRLRALNDRPLADKLESLFTIFLRLRYDEMTVIEIIDGLGIRGMEQNPGIKAYIDRGKVEGRVEGREEATRAMLLRQGTVRFGKPTKRALAKLNGITDLAVLEDLGVRLLGAANWKELLTTPATK